MNQSLSKALAERIMILDGGFGTMIQGYDLSHLDPKDRASGDVLCLSAPEIVADIHRRYLQAGADIIETNTFNANAISLSDYGLQDKAYEIALAGARIARKAADEYSTEARRRYVAGSVGPTNRTLSMSADVNEPAARDVTYKRMYDAYHTQIKGLIDGGVDMILVETVFDTLNAKAALSALRDLSAEIPVMISATLSDASGRTLTGQTVEAFCASVMHARPMSLGLNCGFGASHLLPYLRRLAASAPTRISVHPNAGLPNVLGGYDETPEMFASHLEQYMREGIVNIVGGCCGTTPEHIKTLADVAAKYRPRPLPHGRHLCILSGLEPLTVCRDTNCVNIGERTNVAGSAKFARLIREGNYDEALSIARAQVQAGAQIVDVCMDAAMIDSAEAMRHFLNLMASEPEVARVPVMIDSSKWEVIEAGLQSTQGKSIVNSISLKEGEERFVEHARRIMNYGAAAVVMLFDEQGQADTYERKISVAARAYKLLTDIGFAAEDIIFDPNILAVATGMPEHDRYARDYIDATRWIKRNLPHAKVSGGVSNLSFAFRGNNQVRKAMHAVFLYHAIAAGMDMAIVNPQMVQLYDDIEPTLLTRIEDLILYRRDDAGERLIEHAKQLLDGDDKAAIATDDWATLPIEQRIKHAMLKGETEHIADDTLQAYHNIGSAVGVIDQLLMPAMTQVGQLFAQGKMFLPQVVKSARVMKQAVAVLEPYIKADSQPTQERATRRPIVIATVKGDVHDIGKNIVGVVLTCNGYDVHDLGVMTPAETIISEAQRLNAAAICLSGLITPSLDEMIHVAEEAKRQGVDTPIVVGGATTSALHTAVKIAPATDGPVIHSTDAADNARIMAQLYGPERDTYLNCIKREQQQMRQEYTRRSAHTCTCCQLPKPQEPTPTSHDYQTETVVTPTIADVADRINWSFLLAAWGIPGRYPEVLSDEAKGTEARKLYADAQRMLQHLSDTQAITLKGVLRTYRAERKGDAIEIEGTTMPMTAEAAALLDKSAGRVTLFALTAGIGAAELAGKYRSEGDDYSAMMVKLLCDRLAEAFADSVLQGGYRLAIGYPAIPDHTLKREVFRLLDATANTGMTLTETNMIVPGETVCGLYFPTKQA